LGEHTEVHDMPQRVSICASLYAILNNL
jgi:hypothetical protein